MKDPILQNNSGSESGNAQNGAENAPSSTQIPPHLASDPPAAAAGSPSPSKRERGRGEGAQASPSPSERERGRGEGAPARRRSGPRTPEGESAVSRNAVKHAIFSKNPVVIVGLETTEDWEDFQAHVGESWAPQGEYERQLAYDIAFGLWRLRRCRVHEAAELTRQVYEAEENLIAEAEDDDEDERGEDGGHASERPAGRRSPRVRIDPVQLRAYQLLNVVPQGWSLDRVLRYETHVRRALLQTIHELEATQARRAGAKVRLARVDFNAGPSLRRPTGPRSSSTFDQLNEDLDRAHRDLAKRRRARRQLPKPADES